MGAREIQIRVAPHPIGRRHDLQSVTASHESPSAADRSIARNAVAAVIIFFVAIAFAGFVAMLPISAAIVGASTENFNPADDFQNWI
jgi:hypothetical protein